MGISVIVNDIAIAVGDAVINGRWIVNTAQFLYDASILGDGQYYLYFALNEGAEGENRDPLNETVDATSILIGSYTVNSKNIVLGKFTVTTGTPVIDEDYTATPNQWGVGAIVPGVSPDGSSYSSVGIYSGVTERILEGIAEPDGFRIPKKMIIDDTDGTPIGKAHLRNRDQILEARNDPTVDDNYVPFSSKSLIINGTEVITSSREIINAASLNTHAIPAGTDALVVEDAVQVITNKKLHDDTITFVDPVDDTRQARLDVGIVSPGNTRVISVINEDMTLVGITNIQTLTNKRLTSPKINEDVVLLATATELNQINDGIVRGGNTAGDIITTDATQTLSDKTLDTPAISVFSSMQHNHVSAVQGGNINYDVNQSFFGAMILSEATDITITDGIPTLVNTSVETLTAYFYPDFSPQFSNMKIEVYVRNAVDTDMTFTIQRADGYLINPVWNTLYTDTQNFSSQGFEEFNLTSPNPDGRYLYRLKVITETTGFGSTIRLQSMTFT